MGQWVRRARHDGKQYRRYTDAHIRAYQHLVRSAVEKVVRAAKNREFMGGGATPRVSFLEVIIEFPIAIIEFPTVIIELPTVKTHFS